MSEEQIQEAVDKVAAPVVDSTLAAPEVIKQVAEQQIPTVVKSVPAVVSTSPEVLSILGRIESHIAEKCDYRDVVGPIQELITKLRGLL